MSSTASPQHLDEGLDHRLADPGGVEVGDGLEGLPVLAALAVERSASGVCGSRAAAAAGMRAALVLPIRGIDPISSEDHTSGIDTVRPRASTPKGNGAPEVPHLGGRQRRGRGRGLVGVPVRDPHHHPPGRAGGPPDPFQEHPELVDVQAGGDLLPPGRAHRWRSRRPAGRSSPAPRDRHGRPGTANRIGPGARSGSSEHNLAAANAWTSRSGVIRRALAGTVACSIHGRSTGAPAAPNTGDHRRDHQRTGSAATTGDATTPNATSDQPTSTPRMTDDRHPVVDPLVALAGQVQVLAGVIPGHRRPAQLPALRSPTAQRARPTTVRYTPRGAHFTARNAYSGARNPWNAATCARYDTPRRAAETGCAIHPGANGRPPRSAHPASAGAGPSSSRNGRAGTTDRGSDGTGTVPAAGRSVRSSGPSSGPSPVPSAGGRHGPRSGPGPRRGTGRPRQLGSARPGRSPGDGRSTGSSPSRSSGGSSSAGQVVGKPGRPAPGRPPEPGDAHLRPAQRTLRPITPPPRSSGLPCPFAARPAARSAGRWTPPALGTQALGERSPASAPRPRPPARPPRHARRPPGRQVSRRPAGASSRSESTYAGPPAPARPPVQASAGRTAGQSAGASSPRR